MENIILVPWNEIWIGGFEMDIQDAKVAKSNAQDRITRILQELENETGTLVSEVEFRRDMLGRHYGKPMDFIKIYITLKV